MMMSTARRMMLPPPLLLGLLLLGLGHVVESQQQQVADQQAPEAIDTDTAPATDSTCAASLLPVQGTDQTVYRVGVLANRGVDIAFDEFNPGFGTYLTATAGQQFDPPLTFETVPVPFGSVLDEIVTTGNYDFLFTNPSIFSCVESELGSNSLVSLMARRRVNDNDFRLTQFGGVIFTRADNDEINSIVDIKGRRYGAVSVSSLGGAQMQFREMRRAGIHHLQDPKQAIFMKKQGDVVNAVLAGKIDVGFVRTDQLERTIDDRTGELLDLQEVKIVNAQEGLISDGKLFPFTVSTPLYPEWNLASLSHVVDDVAQAVQSSLLHMNDHAVVAPYLEECQQSRNCTPTDVTCLDACFDALEPWMFERCDTTATTALLAADGLDKGRYYGWRSTLSFKGIHFLHQETQFLTIDENTLAPKCVRATALEDAVVCPPGHFKRPPKDIEQGCERAGLDCYGYSCLCSPCVKAFDVDFFQFGAASVTSSSRAGLQVATNDTTNMEVGHKGCDKFAICGVVEQKGTITFHAVDNKKRDSITFSVKVLVGESAEEFVMTRVTQPEEATQIAESDDDLYVHSFTFDASTAMVGIIILEVYADDTQIPESPFRFQVTPPDCSDHHRRVADPSGECVCENNTVEIGGTCIPLSILLPSIIAPLAVLIGALILYYVDRRRKQEDSIWKVKPTDIKYDAPPTVLGRGTFGLVLLGEYRGTQVAVKRVLPPKEVAKGIEDTAINKATVDEAETNGIDPLSQKKAVSFAQNKAKSPQTGGGTTSQFDFDDVETGDHAGSVSIDEAKYTCSTKSNGAEGFSATISSKGSANKTRSGPSSTAASNRLQLFRGLRKDNDYIQLQKDFVKEMRQLSKLRHPCITTVMGAVISKKMEPLLVMEHMELGSLHDLLHNESMVIEGEIILPVLRDIARGIRFLHAATPTICHSDLKSPNVLVDSKFRAKVADFGFSQKKYFRQNAAGTPFWMAPELLRNETSNTPASDIFSFGIVLYEVFSRKEPYENEDSEAILRDVADPNINKRPPVPPSCPNEVAELMKSCLQANPECRPTAEDIDQRLKMLDADQVEPGTAIVSMQTKKSSAMERTEELLYQIFPKHVAEMLRNGRKVEPESYADVTVFFSDIVGYTKISSKLSPSKVSSLLDRLYTKFDELCGMHNVFKVETIGDAYMAVTNLATEQPEHHRIMAMFALDMMEVASTVLIDEEDTSLGHVKIRAGIHSGPVMAHVVGSRNPRYSLIGDSVNTASRMESTSLPGRIQCSEGCAGRLREDAPDLNIVPRGKIQVKGKGEMNCFWIKSLDATGSSLLGDFAMPKVPSSLTKSSESKTNQFIQRNVDLLLDKLKLIVTHREASKLLNMVPGMEQVQSASSAILSLPGVEQVSTASTAILKAPVRHASSALSNIPGVSQAHSSLTRRPTLALDGTTTFDEVQDIIRLPDFNRRVARKEKSLLHKTELPEKVVQQVWTFVKTIASMYRDNPFHNFEHASHVAQSMNKLLYRVVAPSDDDWDETDAEKSSANKVLHDYSCGISSDPLVQFSVVVSALIHDVDHSGVPNATLVAEKNVLATVYKGKSVAEQNSVDLSWQLLMSPAFEDLQKTIYSTKGEMRRFRQLVVNSVMATDIVDKELKQLRNNRWEKAFSEAPLSREFDGDDQDPCKIAVNRKATIIIEHLIQASDVAHTMQHWPVYRKWNEKLLEEMYLAFKMGRGNDPVPGWYKGEIGFFDFYIIPLAKKLKDCGVFGSSSDECLNNALRNRKLWEDRGEEVVAEMVENIRARSSIPLIEC